MFDPLDILLPSPRDDEPASLRQDIIDEVRDHLHSALLRELHRTPDENLAKQTVLQRFGDPAALVRKLWLQALRDKIMTQKILSTSALLMAVACLIGVLLMNQLVQQNQKVNADLIQQMKDSNTQLLAQFQTLAGKFKSDPAPLNPEWCSLKLRFALDKSAGPAAKDFRVQLSDVTGPPTGDRQMPPMNYVVNDSGTIDFGALKFGRYSLYVFSPSGIQLAGQVLTLRPQQNVSGEIICPSAPPRDVSLAAEPKYVDSKDTAKFLFLCEFVSSPLMVDNRPWVIPPYANRPLPNGSFGFAPGQGVGGGGFGGGGGMFNVIDRLDDQILQASLPSTSLGSTLRIIVTDKGDLVDLAQSGDGVALAGQSLPEDFNSRHSVADLQCMIWTPRHESHTKSLTWHGVDLKLRSITVFSLPHNLYVIEKPNGEDAARSPANNRLTPPLLVSKLPTDHPLRTFTARPGEANKLTIDVSKFPLDWQLEIDHGLKKFAPLQQELKEYWEKKDKADKASAAPKSQRTSRRSRIDSDDQQPAEPPQITSDDLKPEPTEESPTSPTAPAEENPPPK